MKKILSIILSITLLTSCNTTKQIIIPKERIEKEICEVEINIKSDDIFLACHEFILDEFCSYNGVLKYHDKETGTLLLEWKHKIKRVEYGFYRYYDIWIDCSTKIKATDNLIVLEHRIVGIRADNTYITGLSEKDIYKFKSICSKTCDDFVNFISRY